MEDVTALHPTHRDLTMTPPEPPRMSRMAYISPAALGNRCRLAHLDRMSELRRGRRLGEVRTARADPYEQPSSGLIRWDLIPTSS
jgi:hypothetical protein